MWLARSCDLVDTTVYSMYIYVYCHTGMAGKNELANAVLGGTSDYLSDIIAILTTLYRANDEEKVCTMLYVLPQLCS